MIPEHEKLEVCPLFDRSSRLGGRGYQIRDGQAVYGNDKNDFDPDSDFDFD